MTYGHGRSVRRGQPAREARGLRTTNSESRKKAVNRPAPNEATAAQTQRQDGIMNDRCGGLAATRRGARENFGLRNGERWQRSALDGSEPRTTNHGPRENPSGRTNPSAPITNAINRLRPNVVLRHPKMRIADNEPRASARANPRKGKNATHHDRPRGLKAHGSGERWNHGFD